MAHDIAIIGAGAAGIGAARRLLDLGFNPIILEARNRAGGRAWTDHKCFPGIPFDRGAHWLHCASENPLVPIADQLGWAYDRSMTYKPRHLFLGGGRTADPLTLRAVKSEMERALARIAVGGRLSDISCADLIDDVASQWRRLVWRTLSQMLGHDPDQCSAMDVARYVDTGEDWPVEDGYGALLAKLSEGLSIRFNTSVLRINASGRLLKLETIYGDLTVSAAVVTVPTDVMAQGGLTFFPEPPAEFMQALVDCPMGVFEKIAVQLDRPIDGFDHAYADVIDGPPIGRAPVNLHVQPFGRPLLVAHLAGRHGDAVSAEGAEAMKACGEELVVHALGSSVRNRILRIEATCWRRDAFSRGSYAICRPGRSTARERIIKGFDERLAMAGEHCWPTCFATVHGAWLSGEAAATRVARMLSE